MTRDAVGVKPRRQRMAPVVSYPLMRAARGLIALSLMTAGNMAAQAKRVGPPAIPVGLDAYRLWEKWPYQRIGARAYMRSTYDRRGGNEGADASHFLYQLSDDFNTALDVEGPGILYFARYNHWHGSPWHYVVDGTDHIVEESSTADPLHPVENSVFLPVRLFPNPLAWTWSITQGADLTWVPIPFERSFQMAYSRTHYGTGYYIYDQYVRGANLSRPIRSWDTQSAPDADVLALIGRAGTDLVPRTGTPEGSALEVEERHGEVTIPSHGSRLVDAHRSGALDAAGAGDFPARARMPSDLSSARLRVVWDDRPEPSIDAPLALFFGAGTLYNRDDREYLVKAFPVYVRFDAERVHLACFFPMPFFRSARLELVGAGGEDVTGIRWSVALRAIQRSAQPRRLLPCHLSRSPIAGAGPGPAPAGHTRDRRRRRLVRSSGGHLIYLFASRGAEDVGRRSAFLFRRQPHAAGPGHRHGGMGRRRRLLGRPQHDPSVCRASHGRGEREGREERAGQD